MAAATRSCIALGIILSGSLLAGCDRHSPAATSPVAQPAAVARLWIPLVHAGRLVTAPGARGFTAVALNHDDDQRPPTEILRIPAGVAAVSLPDGARISGTRMTLRLQHRGHLRLPSVDLTGAVPRRATVAGGWSLPTRFHDRDVRWALAPDSEIEFEIDQPTTVDVAFKTHHFFATSLNIELNGKPLDVLERRQLEGPDGIAFKIPAAATQPGRNVLRLKHVGTPPPRGTDPRQLSVLFEGIVIRPDDAHAPRLPGLPVDAPVFRSGWGEVAWSGGLPGRKLEAAATAMLPVQSPRDRLLRVWALGRDATSVRVRAAGKVVGDLAAGELASETGATLVLPAEALRAAEVQLELSPIAPEAANAAEGVTITAIGLEPWVDDAELATTARVGVDGKVLAEFVVRGPDWSDHEARFDQVVEAAASQSLEIGIDNPDLFVDANLISVYAEIGETKADGHGRGACETVLRDPAHLYRIEFERPSLDSRTVRIVGAAHLWQLALSADANPRPIVRVAPGCMHSGGQIVVHAATGGGTRREIGTLRFEPQTEHTAAFHSLPLDLLGNLDGDARLAFELRPGRPVKPGEPEPFVLLDLSDLRPLTPAAGVRGHSPPDILLISLDTVRADFLSCYGGKPGTTPELDRFADEAAALFERAYSATPWTLPSHMSMLSGLPPSECGAYRTLAAADGIRPTTIADPPFGVPAASYVTVAAKLRELGYETKAITDGGFVGARYGLGRGFDSFEEMPAADARNSVERALEYLQQERNPARPFFLFLHTYEVHAPYWRTGELRRSGLLSDEIMAEIDRRFPKCEMPYIGSVAAVLQDLGVYRADVARELYRGGLAYTDAALGTLFDSLKASGLWDDALIIIVSDHGEEFADREPNRFWDDHGHQLHPEQTHVPLLVKWPGGRFAGRRVGVPAHHIDIAPTVLAAAGAADLSAYPGTNLADLVEHPPAAPRALLSDTLINTYPEVKAVRVGDAGIFSSFLRTPEVYDLSQDPLERRPLAPDAAANPGELLAVLREQTLRSAAGELLFWYRSARPIERFELVLRHDRAPATLFAYDGLVPQNIDARPEVTRVWLDAAAGSGPSQVIFGMIDASPPMLQLELSVDGVAVDSSRIRVGLSALPPGTRFNPLAAVVPLDRLDLLRVPAVGELGIFAVGALDLKKPQAGAESFTEQRHLSNLRALGYIGE